MLLLSLVVHADPGVCLEFGTFSCYVVVGHAGGISERQLYATSSCSLVSSAFGSRSSYEGKTHITHELFSYRDAFRQGVDRVSRDDFVFVFACFLVQCIEAFRFVISSALWSASGCPLFLWPPLWARGGGWYMSRSSCFCCPLHRLSQACYLTCSVHGATGRRTAEIIRFPIL